MKSKKIALIGVNGQLGNDLQRVLSKENSYTVFPLIHADIEISDPESIENTLSNINPDIIINAAAYNNVDEIENNTQKAMLINGIANKHLAEYCQKKDIALVYISTDYVFGENKERKIPYKESDCPGPINAYGVSKLAGEYFVRYSCKRYFIVRTSGLFGKTGSSKKGGNFIESVIKIAKEKNKVEVVTDQILTPTCTLDLAKQILLLVNTNNYGLYHATAQEECSWFTFAQEIFKLMRMNINVIPITSDLSNRPAKRPHYSVLENYNLKRLSINFMPDWKEGLKDYLKERKTNF